MGSSIVVMVTTVVVMIISIIPYILNSQEDEQAMLEGKEPSRNGDMTGTPYSITVTVTVVKVRIVTVRLVTIIVVTVKLQSIPCDKRAR